ncbi:ABC transporter permease [Streptacidiphilus sp. EB129]|jgi:ABC-2 type transport system permease protein|uniref:ABC transporter permease n=1 Tax=Streptacidiphilus sp. EB129 TaxID=3156262 RepID=UPI003517BB3E
MQIISDSVLLFRRHLDTTMKSKISILIGMVQPVLYLLLFGPMLEKALPDASGSNAWQMYVPGLLVQLGLFGAGYAGFNLIPDMRAGVIERMRVTPVSRLALLLGRVMRDAVVMLIQAVMLTAVAVGFGLRAPLVGIVASFVMVLALAISLASMSYLLALSLPTEYLFAPVINTVALPLMLLSGILLPMTFAPGWLSVLSHFSPFRYIVDGMRDLFLGHYATRSVLEGVIVAAVLVVASLALGTRKFVRANS